MNRPALAPCSLRVGTLLPLGALALVGAALLNGAARQPVVAAAGGARVTDVDQDGLPDAQEAVVGTMMRAFDSDGDGYSDAEEFARHSSPRTANSIPEARPIDVGLSAHSRGGGLHVLAMVYTADGTLKGKHLTMLASTGDRLLEMSGDFLARRARFDSRPGREPGSRLFSIDFEIAPEFVFAVREMSFSASVAAPATGAAGIADVLDLAAVEDTICIRFDAAELGVRSTSSGSSNSTATTTGGTTTGTKLGGVYIPVYTSDRATGAGDPPGSTATPGQVCVQETVVVGAGGGMIVSEVVSAECVDGWDGFCGPICAAQVGTTVRSVDPVIFTGG